MNKILLTFLLISFSCGEKEKLDTEDASSDASLNDVSDMSANNSKDDGSVVCDNLNELECKTNDHCLAVFGAPYDYTQKCLNPEVFAYCATEPIQCNNGIEGNLYDPSTGNCWIQGGACIPNGWMNFSDAQNFPKNCADAREAANCK